MEKKVSNAFKYLFQDSEWKFKFFVLAALNTPLIILEGVFYSGKTQILANIISSIPALIILGLISTVTCGLAFGYQYRSMNFVSRADLNSNNLLPPIEEDFWSNLSYLLKAAVAGACFGLAMIVPFLLIMAVPTLLAGLFPQAFMALIFLPVVFQIIFSLFIVLITPAMFAIFVTEFKPTSFLAFKKMFVLIKSNFGLYIRAGLLYVLILLFANVFAFIFLVVPTQALALAIVAILLLSTYFQFATTYLVGILAKSYLEVAEQ